MSNWRSQKCRYDITVVAVVVGVAAAIVVVAVVVIFVVVAVAVVIVTVDDLLTAEHWLTSKYRSLPNRNPLPE